jgi:hypothetical protein
VSNSPMAVTMLPGPCKSVIILISPDNLQVSSFVEDNPPYGCYLHLSLCYFRLDLKDTAGNFVSTPNVLSKTDADFVFDGPLASVNRE